VELNHRKDYFKIIEWKASYGISWHRTSKISHNIRFVNLNYASLIDSTSQFQELVDQSALIEQSYRSQFILGPSYSFTFNNTLNQQRRFRTYYRADLETSGNVIQGMYLLGGNRDQEKTVLGVPFSQYFRFYSDFRAYYQVGRRNTTQLAFRSVMGWGKAYGNSGAVPYTQQFFIGGSNSLRPITARVVGPGRFLEFDETAYNQVGDIKIENNLEFRFKIWYVFHGAVWSDVGNIWLMKEDPERPGSGIRWGKLFQDSYITSGLGLRVDLNFLVVRADYGTIMYLPFLDPGYRWLWQNKLPLRGLVFGIGYPF
jgi:outer membrane protein assembly factor BamA